MIWWMIGAALFGVAALSIWGAFRSPDFVAGLTAVVAKAAVKAIAPIVAKRMTPEQEKAFQACVRRGGDWDHIRKRCKD